MSGARCSVSSDRFLYRHSDTPIRHCTSTRHFETDIESIVSIGVPSFHMKLYNYGSFYTVSLIVGFRNYLNTLQRATFAPSNGSVVF